MVSSYHKNLRRMFKSNILRIITISLIVAIGVSVTTGICAIPIQMRDALPTLINQQQLFLVSEAADKIEIIGNVLPPFFILVSALTALTTIARLIDEERAIFACFKTLGYSSFLIVFRYMIFAVVCVVLGCGIGLVLGNFVLRPSIYNVVKIKFDVPDLGGVYLQQGVVWAGAMCVVLLLTTLIVSLMRNREKPAELLRPKSPRAGKQIFLEFIPFFWRRLKFKIKSSLRNIFRFKSRLIMTVLSIAGATVMLFVGVGLNSSFNAQQNTAILGMEGFVESMRAIAAIITLCGILLAVLVLFNLTNINIEERKREIATLKVLGYKPLEVAGFIYRELMILAAIGVAIGLPSGYYLLGFLFDYLDFGSLDLVKWYVWVGVCCIAFFAVILADALLYQKINKIEMISSLKVVE